MSNPSAPDSIADLLILLRHSVHATSDMDINSILRALWAILLSVARMWATLMVLPFFGRQIIPSLVKHVYILSLSLIIYPMIIKQMPEQMSIVLLFGVLIKEVMIGMCIGFVIAAPSGAMRNVGALIDNARGANTPGSNDPISGAVVGGFDAILNQVFVTFFFVTGADLLLFGALYNSLHIWPILHFWPNFAPQNFVWVLKQFDYFMKLAVVLASPILASMLFIDVGLAFISKFIQQLQVFTLAMPIKNGIAIFVAIIYLGTLLFLINIELHKIPNEVSSVMSFISTTNSP